MRQFEQACVEAKLAHHFERRGVQRIAAEVAKEIGMLLEHQDIDAGAGEEQAQHHSGRPAAGYLHPYDVDTAQERFMHPELGGSRALNRLMYWGRGRVCRRLDRLFGAARVMPYREYVARVLEGAAVPAP